jgi:hypothetical protein
VCNLPAHKAYEVDYKDRFHRLTAGEIKRILRQLGNRDQTQVIDPDGARPQEGTNNPLQFPIQPQRRQDLPPGPGGEDGGPVVHRFRARTTNCIQTLQWSCGTPIGWGKCYDSESPSQVYDLIQKIFPDDNLHPRPSFFFYDNACSLKAHISTQDPDSPWLDETRFCVDAWHYINHRVTDSFCRRWCNPAPLDGSQPDLIINKTDANGTVHAVRAYNSETAEQFNAWLNAFEGPLRQMTDYNFDFFVHVLMYLYKEIGDKRRGDEDGDEED